MNLSLLKLEVFGPPALWLILKLVATNLYQKKRRRTINANIPEHGVLGWI